MGCAKWRATQRRWSKANEAMAEGPPHTPRRAAELLVSIAVRPRLSDSDFPRPGFGALITERGGAWAALVAFLLRLVGVDERTAFDRGATRDAHVPRRGRRRNPVHRSARRRRRSRSPRTCELASKKSCRSEGNPLQENQASAVAPAGWIFITSPVSFDMCVLNFRAG